MSNAMKSPNIISSPVVLPLMADLQFMEPYATTAINRKMKHIVQAGFYKGFSPVPGAGLAVKITSPNGGAASIDVDLSQQISVQQTSDISVAVAAGKTTIIALEAVYTFGVKTRQVDSGSTVDATRFVTLVDKALASNQIEVCRVVVPAGAKQVTEPMIDISHRINRTVGIVLSDAINSTSDIVAASSKAVNNLRISLRSAAYKDTGTSGDRVPLLNGANTWSLEQSFSKKTNFKEGIEISHKTPYIDFHFDNSSGDYTTRVIEAESGVLTLMGDLIADKGFGDATIGARMARFRGNSAGDAIISATRTIYIRPSGNTSSEVQMLYSSTGDLSFNGTNMTVSGDVSSNTVLAVKYGSGFSPKTQGTYISWNRLSGSGRAEFICHRGTGTGGFNFWNGTSDPTLIATIDGSGNGIFSGGMTLGKALAITSGGTGAANAKDGLKNLGGLPLTGGALKNPDSNTDAATLTIAGVQHTPLVLSRNSANANLSIGFKLNDNVLYRFGVDLNRELRWGQAANAAENYLIYHSGNLTVGTSGNAVPLLNTVNTWSAAQKFTTIQTTGNIGVGIAPSTGSDASIKFKAGAMIREGQGGGVGALILGASGENNTAHNITLRPRGEANSTAQLLIDSSANVSISSDDTDVGFVANNVKFRSGGADKNSAFIEANRSSVHLRHTPGEMAIELRLDGNLYQTAAQSADGSSLARRDFVTRNYLPLVGGTVSGDTTFNGFLHANKGVTGSILSHDLESQTVSLDTLDLKEGSPQKKYYYVRTNGLSSGITGRPDDSVKNAFMLTVELIRWNTARDYISRQKYVTSNEFLEWERYCINGVWSAWRFVPQQNITNEWAAPQTFQRVDIKGGLELYYTTPFIDFHFNNTTTDYTSRLIENESGTLTCIGNFIASRGNNDTYIGAQKARLRGTSTGIGVLSAEKDLYLRPAGDANTSVQIRYRNDGQFELQGTSLSASGFIASSTALCVRNSSGYSPTAPGAHIAWNRVSGSGRMELICHRDTGAGGFNFWNGTKDPTLIASIDGTGNAVFSGGMTLGKAMAIESGGTGASDAAGGRENLGLGDGAAVGIQVPIVGNGNQSFLKIATIKDCGASAGYFQLMIVGANTYGGQRHNIDFITVSCRGAANMTSETVNTFMTHRCLQTTSNGQARLGVVVNKDGTRDIYLIAPTGWFSGVVMHRLNISGDGTFITGMVNNRSASGLAGWTQNEPAGIALINVHFIVDSGNIDAMLEEHLGSAAHKNIGTNGGTVPLLNGTNTWSAKQTFSGGLSGELAGNSSSATKLKTSRKVRVNLASTSEINFDGSANMIPGVTGVLALANGGTGSADAAGARKAFGLGTAAVKNTGTSGDAVPLLNGTNTWSNAQVFQSLITPEKGVVGKISAIMLDNQTLSLNSLNMSGGFDLQYMFYRVRSDGSGANITGRPDDAFKKSFSLKVEQIRWAGTTDYVTKQTYMMAQEKNAWERYCESGSWTKWRKVPQLNEACEWEKDQTFNGLITVGATSEISEMRLGSSQFLRDNAKRGLIISSESTNSSDAAAGLFLRPRGSLDSTMQMRGSAKGWETDTFTATNLNATTLKAETVNAKSWVFAGKGPSSVDPEVQGTYMGWNRVLGEGRSDLINLRGTGIGGFDLWTGTEGECRRFARFERNISYVTNDANVSGAAGFVGYSPKLGTVLRGRGASGSPTPDGAFFGMQMKETVGAMHTGILALEGFGGASRYWNFTSNGDFENPGVIRTSQLVSTGEVQANNGAARFAGDGNVYGTIWGGWLRDWINSNIMGRMVIDIRLGSVESTQVWKGAGYVDQGPYVLTGAENFNTDDHIDTLYRRPMQKNVNGTWYNVWFV